MGNYNDFDLDIKKVQENGMNRAATGNTVCFSIEIATAIVCTAALSCNGTCTCEGKASCADTCGNTCGGVGNSCSAHCR